jgi:CubicO group peptidase (beta-lactamase class C family)
MPDTGVQEPGWVADTISATFGDLDRSGAPGGVVGVAVGGTVVHLGGFGDAVPDHGVPWDADTSYRIASISKTMTAQAVLGCVRRGLLSLDADARALAPELGAFRVPITVLDLLTMSAGLWHDEEVARMCGVLGPTDDGYFADLTASQGAPMFAPGSAQVYSCANYRVLSRILERVTGTAFDDAIERLVFAPLDLGDTASTGYFWQRGAREARWYSSIEERSWNEVLLPVHTTGDGAVRSSGRDLLRWLIASTRSQDSLVPTLAELAVIGADRGVYRAGLEVRAPGGVELWTHRGSTGTTFLYLPEGDVGVIVMHNGPADIDERAYGVLRTVAGHVGCAVPPTPVRLGEDRRLDAALGRYVDITAGMTFELVDWSGDVAAGFQGAWASLVPDPGGWTFLDSAIYGRFELTAAGTVVMQEVDGAAHRFTRVDDESNLDPSRLEGIYRGHALDATVSVVQSDDGWQLQLGGAEHPDLRRQLEPWGPLARSGGITVAPRGDPVSALELSTRGARGVTFRRV